jgi:cytoskeletal protein CcmA (bactofilin family)
MFGANEREEFSTPAIQSEDTVIGSTIKIEGDLVSNGNIMVEGEVVGSLKTEKTLTVGNGAKVNADVKATNAIVSGEVNGNMSVGEEITLNESSVVNGDIQAKVVVIKAGAKFNGKCSMTEGVSMTSEPAAEETEE